MPKFVNILLILEFFCFFFNINALSIYLFYILLYNTNTIMYCSSCFCTKFPFFFYLKVFITSGQHFHAYECICNIIFFSCCYFLDFLCLNQFVRFLNPFHVLALWHMPKNKMALNVCLCICL